MGLIAIREDEDKAATIGINTPVYKIIAFVASAVFVGMAGGVYGYYLTFIDPRGMFNILLSVQIVLSLLLGGRATLWGPVLGAFIVEPLNEIANNKLGGGNARLLLFGGLLVAGRAVPAAAASSRRSTRCSSAGAHARQGRPGRRAARTGVEPARARRRRRRRSAPATAAPLLEVKGLEQALRRRCRRSTARRSRCPRARSPG